MNEFNVGLSVGYESLLRFRYHLIHSHTQILISLGLLSSLEAITLKKRKLLNRMKHILKQISSCSPKNKLTYSHNSKTRPTLKSIRLVLCHYIINCHILYSFLKCVSFFITISFSSFCPSTQTDGQCIAVFKCSKRQKYLAVMNYKSQLIH